MKLPSKLLVEKVLKVNIKYLADRYDGDLLPYETADGWQTIDVYNFANKCKTWMLTNHNYSTRTVNILSDEEVYWQVALIEYTDESETLIFHNLDNSTEPEAIFVAAERVLKM